MTPIKTYEVWWTERGFSQAESFDSLELARAYGRERSRKPATDVGQARVLKIVWHSALCREEYLAAEFVNGELRPYRRVWEEPGFFERPGNNWDSAIARIQRKTGRKP